MAQHKCQYLLWLPHGCIVAVMRLSAGVQMSSWQHVSRWQGRRMAYVHVHRDLQPKG